jgi:hypothetical protein
MKTDRSLLRLAAGLPIILTLLFSTSCNGQQNKTIPEQKKPDVRYKVDKEYDKQGNLIRYDSSYVYSSSAVNDSLLNGLMDRFRKNSTMDFQRSFLYSNDSIFDFFDRSFRPSRDFFQDHTELFEHWQKQMKELEQGFHPQPDQGSPNRDTGTYEL